MKTIYENNGEPRFCLGERRGPQRTGNASLDEIARLSAELLRLVAGYELENWDGRERYDEIREVMPAMMDRYFADKRSGGKETGLASPKRGRVAYHRGRSAW